MTPRKTPVSIGAPKGAAPVKRGPGRPRKVVAQGAGARLRAELEQKGDAVGVSLLVRQAARVADRLETIDRLLAGDAAMWATVSLPRPDSKRGRVVVEMRVDNLLVEERNQTTLFRHLLGEIHKQRAGIPTGPDDDDEDDLVD